MAVEPVATTEEQVVYRFPDRRAAWQYERCPACDLGSLPVDPHTAGTATANPGG